MGRMGGEMLFPAKTHFRKPILVEIYPKRLFAAVVREGYFLLRPQHDPLFRRQHPSTRNTHPPATPIHPQHQSTRKCYSVHSSVHCSTRRCYSTKPCSAGNTHPPAGVIPRNPVPPATPIHPQVQFHETLFRQQHRSTRRCYSTTFPHATPRPMGTTATKTRISAQSSWLLKKRAGREYAVRAADFHHRRERVCEMVLHPPAL